MATALLLLTGWAVVGTVAVVFNHLIHANDDDDDDG